MNVPSTAVYNSGACGLVGANVFSSCLACGGGGIADQRPYHRHCSCSLHEAAAPDCAEALISHLQLRHDSSSMHCHGKPQEQIDDGDDDGDDGYDDDGGDDGDDDDDDGDGDDDDTDRGSIPRLDRTSAMDPSHGMDDGYGMINININKKMGLHSQKKTTFSPSTMSRRALSFNDLGSALKSRNVVSSIAAPASASRRRSNNNRGRFHGHGHNNMATAHHHTNLSPNRFAQKSVSLCDLSALLCSKGSQEEGPEYGWNTNPVTDAVHDNGGLHGDGDGDGDDDSDGDGDGMSMQQTMMGKMEKSQHMRGTSYGHVKRSISISDLFLLQEGDGHGPPPPPLHGLADNNCIPDKNPRP